MSLHIKSTMNQLSVEEEASPMSDEIEENSDGDLYTETIYINTDDFPNICRLCLKSEKLHELKDHLHLTDVIRNLTNIEVKRFDGFPQNICESCIVKLEGILEFIDFTRTCNESLNRVLESTNEKRHMCEVCPKSFAHIGALKRHLERHNEIQKFTCSICNRGFGRKNHLTHHLTTHTADKPFYCNICSRGFATKKKLDQHQKQHFAIKTLQCEVCPKKFRNMQELRQHTRHHTGDRPYSCKPCNKSFRQLGHLNLHISTKHKKEKVHSEDMIVEDIVIEHVEDDEEEQEDTYNMGADDTVISHLKHEKPAVIKSEPSIDEKKLFEEKSEILPVCVLCSNRFEVCIAEET